ncbi:uncharacterized protein LOC132563047 [Ylistrum balloti]|uniref:uncharacterized protein LOC132563047 n=1 Tax=Ylistrum balloti TaxID=509963 RepID=UPI0029058A69|nr:uncharacterized protein LOC132563047 [Ylistrum balloti]
MYLFPGEKLQQVVKGFLERGGIPDSVCDHNMTFTDVLVGWLGGVQDTRVFNNSNIVSPYSSLLTSYRDTGSLTSCQEKYNYKHAATPNTNECSFVFLKGRWRKLHYMNLLSITDICEIIFACCVFHNFVMVRMPMKQTKGVP